jgi:hypothetical protein
VKSDQDYNVVLLCLSLNNSPCLCAPNLCFRLIPHKVSVYAGLAHKGVAITAILENKETPDRIGEKQGRGL